MVKPLQEQLLHNFLDKNFEAMLFPLNKALSVLLFPNYTIQDGFVTPNNRSQKLKSFFLIVVLLIVTYYRFQNSVVLSAFKYLIDFVYISIFFDLIYYSFMLILLFVFNIKNTYDNVDLVLNLQKAVRNFRCVDKDIKQLTFWNWVSMVLIPIYYFIILTMEDIKFLNIAGILNFLPLIYFDITAVYTIRVMWVIVTVMKMWVRKMQQCIQRQQGLERTDDVMRQGKIMLESYRHILQAFDLFKNICQVPVIFHTLEVISHGLFYLQVNVDLKKQRPEVSAGEFMLEISKLSITSWVMKNGALLSLLCVACESFYSYVGEAQRLCSQALTLPNNMSEESHHLFKSVCRLHSARARRARVVGAIVDARLPRAVVSIVATYVVVMLQFDFL